MTKVWLLILSDEGVEVLSVWDSEEGAKAEMEGCLESKKLDHISNYYWWLHRLRIEPFTINMGRWSNLL